MLDDAARSKMMKRSCLLYDGIIRNQRHVPCFDSPMCTHSFLQDVYDNTVFVFDLHDVRVRNVATCPTLGEL